MTARAGVPGGWAAAAAGASAREQVAAVVADLCRARWRQAAASCAWNALLCWLLASTVAVAAVRVGLIAAQPSTVVASLLAVCVALGAGAALLRRPDDLEVAIAADLALNLKQRLSTAWELARSGHDDAITERLAMQAVRARLPARARSMRVFAPRVNTAGLLSPVAAILLALVSLIDLGHGRASAPQPIDESVIGEGVRLREYGQRMEGRARREDLTHSVDASQRLQRLGARMESGALTRSDALSRLGELDGALDDARRSALGAGPETRIAPLSVNPLDGGAPLGAPDPTAMLERLLDGTLGVDDARALGSDPGALSRSGVSAEALEEALSRFSAGDRQRLRDILETLSRSEQAARDAAELGRAREQIARARESLGAPPARDARAGSQPSEAVAGGSDDGTSGGPERSDADIDGGGFDMPAGSRPADTAATGSETPRTPARAPEVIESGPVLKANGQPGDGGVFVSEARVLPRAGEARTGDAGIDARYAGQLEEALSKEHFPAHRKAFIRRYFLNLSEGVTARTEER